MAGKQFTDSPQGRRPRTRISETQDRRQAGSIHLARTTCLKQRSKLAAEAEVAVATVEKQRLLSEAVARQPQVAGAFIHRGKGEHAFDLLTGARYTDGCDEFEKHFRVRSGLEVVSLPFHPLSQLAKVVNLPVKD